MGRAIDFFDDAGIEAERLNFLPDECEEKRAGRIPAFHFNRGRLCCSVGRRVESIAFFVP